MSTDPAAEFDPALPLGTVAQRSWRAIKTPVMVWLWTLNVLYWMALFYWPRAEAMWALVAYLAVGPMIAAMIACQRGLTRLSGLIHLPWVPFSVYLGLRLYSDALGPALSPASDPVYFAWVQVLFVATLLCLLLDAVDVLRWLSGERYVLGTPAAAAAGASKLAPVSP